MPKKEPVRLPPLSIEALAQIHKAETYLLSSVASCYSGNSLNTARAIDIIRTYAVLILDLKLHYYSSLPDYSSNWLDELETGTLSSIVGLLPSDIARRQPIEQSLQVTIHDHLKKQERIAGSQQQAPAAVTSNLTPISKQIDDLRCECGITVEALAESIGLAPRSVYRHLSGKAAPRNTHLTAYARLFSEKLKRQVRFYTPKRQ